ncbi:MAG: hypothetical protein ACLSH6_03310 [Limosilactobacillus pontis]
MQLSDQDKAQIEDGVHRAGGEIITNKEPYYGVVSTSPISPVPSLRTEMWSSQSQHLWGSVRNRGPLPCSPAVINSQGIGQVIEYPLTDDEQVKMAHSADAMKSVLNSIQL